MPGPGAASLQLFQQGDAWAVRILPDGPTFPADSFGVTWLDDRRFAYFHAQAAHADRRDDRRAEVQTIPCASVDYQAILASDGKTIYDTGEPVSHVTRHMLANFGDRPWR